MTAPIIWNSPNGTRRKYACSIAYEGHIGVSATLVIVFVEVTEEMEDFK